MESWTYVLENALGVVHTKFPLDPSIQVFSVVQHPNDGSYKPLQVAS